VREELAALISREELALSKKLEKRRAARMKLLNEGHLSEEKRVEIMAQLEASEAIAIADLKKLHVATQVCLCLFVFL
jgi:hypothetical protein